MADERHMHLITDAGKPESAEAVNTKVSPVPTVLLGLIFTALYPHSPQPDEAAKWLIENFRAEYWPSDLGKISADEWRACADAMRAIADQWDDAAH
jgi:hypothetical protein